GLIVSVPRVEAGAITIDGTADEAAWANAYTNIDVVANWGSYGPVGDALEGPDLFNETKLLWSDGVLYVHHRLFDVELFWGGDTGSFWNSDMVLIGLDPSAAGDTLFGPNFDGGIENAPSGPHTYFINDPAGFTIGWNEGIIPSDSGWVEGVVFVDEENLEWGIEAAFHLPEVMEGGQIGFDIGGAQASEAQCVEGYCDYAYYAWQTGAGGDPGAINRDASEWALLTFGGGTAIEQRPEVPGAFVLEQNYPNPFNPTTTIEFGLKRAGNVNVSVFNALGQRVAVLANGVQQAGTYRVEWDAANAPSGVYLYQLEVDGQVVAARKMVLMR
ncbi:MAG TPA: T9SS type A sorting domain-containing protein, partial [Rhodothermales bacterium]